MRQTASRFVLRLLATALVSYKYNHVSYGYNNPRTSTGGYVSELEVDIISAVVYSVAIRYAKSIRSSEQIYLKMFIYDFILP